MVGVEKIWHVVVITIIVRGDRSVGFSMSTLWLRFDVACCSSDFCPGDCIVLTTARPCIIGMCLLFCHEWHETINYSLGLHLHPKSLVVILVLFGTKEGCAAFFSFSPQEEE